MMTQQQLGILLVAVALALPGCGRGTGEVSGVVKYRGQPLPTGTISFYDEARGVWSGEIKDGSYTAPNVPTGNTRIAVTTPPAVSIPGLPAAKAPTIPDKYGDIGRSGLSYRVRSGQQTLNLDLD